MARRARILRGEQAGDHAQALRRHLVRVTQRLLAAHGLTGLTTRVIAREAEVSDGVLYNHFADKDELVVIALADRITDLVRRYLDSCPGPGQQDLRSGLTRLAAATLQFQAEALPLVGALLSRPELFNRLLERMHANEPGPQQLWAHVVNYVEAEQRLGTVAADVDPPTVAHVLFGAQHLTVLFSALGGDLLKSPPGSPPGSGPDEAPGSPSDSASVSASDEERLVAFLTRACAATP